MAETCARQQVIQHVTSPNPRHFPLGRLVFLATLMLVLGLPGGYLLFGLGTHATHMTQPPNALRTSTSPASPAISATPTVDEIANWQTYNDVIYRFSVKYPAGWITSIDHAYYDGSTYHVLLRGKFLDDIRIDVLPNPSRLSSLQYVKLEAFKSDLPGWNNDKQPTILLNLPGLDATKVSNVIGGAGPYGPVVFIANGETIVDIQTKEGLLTYILSTFHFRQ